MSGLPVFAPAPVLLSSFSRERRESVRPLHARGPDFDDLYDADTLIYDGVHDVAEGRALLLCPPFHNLAPAMRGMTLTADGRPCPFRIVPMNRHAQIRVEVPKDCAALTLDAGFGRATLPLAANKSPLFAGCRVVLTQSKNNDLVWIQDWLRFNRDINGANGALIYDNGSTDYTVEDLAAALLAVGGLKQVAVVHWPFRFGPQGDGKGNFWDSDYCQHGVLEHARRTFLARAASVMNADIDEFVFTTDGGSVFERVERSWIGSVRYGGRWIMGIEGHSPDAGPGVALRHKDFDTALRPQMKRKALVLSVDALACVPKWSAVPGRCPPNSQWGIHKVHGWPVAELMTNRVTYRHFREINKGWKYRRSDRSAFDPQRHEVDEPLKALMARVDWER